MATGRISMDSLINTFHIKKATKMGCNGEFIDCVEVGVYSDNKYVTTFYVQMFSITANNKPKILANERYLEIAESTQWVVDVRPGKVVCWGIADTVDVNTTSAEIEVQGEHILDALFGYIPLEK